MMYERGWVHGAATKVLRREMLAVELEGEDSTGHLCLVGAQVDIGKSKEKKHKVWKRVGSQLMGGPAAFWNKHLEASGVLSCFLNERVSWLGLFFRKISVQEARWDISLGDKYKIQKRNKPGLSQWEERWRKYSVLLIFRDWVGR